MHLVEEAHRKRHAQEAPDPVKERIKRKSRGLKPQIRTNGMIKNASCILHNAKNGTLHQAAGSQDHPGIVQAVGVIVGYLFHS